MGDQNLDNGDFYSISKRAEIEDCAPRYTDHPDAHIVNEQDKNSPNCTISA